MFESLLENKYNFSILFMDYGINIKEFATKYRLQALYYETVKDQLNEKTPCCNIADYNLLINYLAKLNIYSKVNVFFCYSES